MIVAQLRGVRFIRHNDKVMAPAYDDLAEATKALEDIASWLGFGENDPKNLSLKRYVRALTREKEKIFDRLKRKPKQRKAR